MRFRFSKILFFTGLVLCFALIWALRRFPMHDVYTVFFVLTADIHGTDSSTVQSIMLQIIIPSIAFFLFFRFLAKRKFVRFFTAKIIASFSLSFFVFSLALAFFSLRLWKYPRIFFQVHGKSLDSEFYKKNYVNPNDVHISFPEKKRNLIVLFLESMESSVASVADGGLLNVSLIPDLTKLAKENRNFSESGNLGGGVNLEGTSWTLAGIMSKFAGVPYFSPFTKNADGGVSCLENAATLGDILSQNGYRCLFSCGSEKTFEMRDVFLERHGFEIHDIVWYKKNNFLPSDYGVFWGFEDAKLFSFAKKELKILSEKNEPFCFSFLTVDTHFPDGYKDENTVSIFQKQIMNVFATSDAQVNAFISWCKKQSWYKNTTIVILGDHNYLAAPLNNFIKAASKNYHATARRWLDIFINDAPCCDMVQRNRMFSSFDMFPTVLESIGCKIDGRSLGFGKSLYGGEKTLIELYGAQKINEELMQKTLQYDALK